MPLNITDKQVDALESIGYIEGTKDGVTLRPGGNLSVKDYETGITADEIRARLSAYQQSTSERRVITSERMDDFNTRTNQDSVSYDEGGQPTVGEEDEGARDSYYYRADTAGNQVVDKIGNKNVITGAPDLPDPSELTGIQGEIARIEEDTRNKVAYMDRTLDRIAAQADSTYRQMVQSIRQIYGARIGEMRKANERLVGLKETVGLRSGRSRYTPTMQAGIIADEEIAGAQRIAKLEGEMLNALANAAAAKEEGDMKRFNASYDRLESFEKQMYSQIADLYKAAVAQDEALVEQRKLDSAEAKAAWEKSLEISERSAPAIAEAMSQFDDPQQQAEFVQKYAEQMGVDPFILLGDAQLALQDMEKADVDIDNVKSLISTRYTSEERAEEKWTDEQAQRDDRTVLREAILEKLESGEITIEDARNAWGRAFPLEEFEKEFAAYITV